MEGTLLHLLCFVPGFRAVLLPEGIIFTFSLPYYNRHVNTLEGIKRAVIILCIGIKLSGAGDNIGVVGGLLAIAVATKVGQVVRRRWSCWSKKFGELRLELRTVYAGLEYIDGSLKGGNCEERLAENIWEYISYLKSTMERPPSEILDLGYEILRKCVQYSSRQPKINFYGNVRVLTYAEMGVPKIIQLLGDKTELSDYEVPEDSPIKYVIFFITCILKKLSAYHPENFHILAAKQYVLSEFLNKQRYACSLIYRYHHLMAKAKTTTSSNFLSCFQGSSSSSHHPPFTAARPSSTESLNVKILRSLMNERIQRSLHTGYISYTHYRPYLHFRLFDVNRIDFCVFFRFLQGLRLQGDLLSEGIGAKIKCLEYARDVQCPDYGFVYGQAKEFERTVAQLEKVGKQNDKLSNNSSHTAKMMRAFFEINLSYQIRKGYKTIQMYLGRTYNSGFNTFFEDELMLTNSADSFAVLMTNIREGALRIERVSSNLFNFIGYNSQELVGKPLSTLVPSPANIFHDLLTKFQESKGHMTELKDNASIFIKTKEGFLRHFGFLMRYCPVRNESLYSVVRLKFDLNQKDEQIMVISGEQAIIEMTPSCLGLFNLGDGIGKYSPDLKKLLVGYRYVREMVLRNEFTPSEALQLVEFRSHFIAYRTLKQGRSININDYHGKLHNVYFRAFDYFVPRIDILMVFLVYKEIPIPLETLGTSPNKFSPISDRQSLIPKELQYYQDGIAEDFDNEVIKLMDVILNKDVDGRKKDNKSRKSFKSLVPFSLREPSEPGVVTINEENSTFRSILESEMRSNIKRKSLSPTKQGSFFPIINTGLQKKGCIVLNNIVKNRMRVVFDRIVWLEFTEKPLTHIGKLAKMMDMTRKEKCAIGSQRDDESKLYSRTTLSQELTKMASFADQVRSEEHTKVQVRKATVFLFCISILFFIQTIIVSLTWLLQSTCFLSVYPAIKGLYSIVDSITTINTISVAYDASKAVYEGKMNNSLYDRWGVPNMLTSNAELTMSLNTTVLSSYLTMYQGFMTNVSRTFNYLVPAINITSSKLDLKLPSFPTSAAPDQNLLINNAQVSKEHISIYALLTSASPHLNALIDATQLMANDPGLYSRDKGYFDYSERIIDDWMLNGYLVVLARYFQLGSRYLLAVSNLFAWGVEGITLVTRTCSIAGMVVSAIWLMFQFAYTRRLMAKVFAISDYELNQEYDKLKEVKGELDLLINDDRNYFKWLKRETEQSYVKNFSSQISNINRTAKISDNRTVSVRSVQLTNLKKRITSLRTADSFRPSHQYSKVNAPKGKRWTSSIILLDFPLLLKLVLVSTYFIALAVAQNMHIGPYRDRAKYINNVVTLSIAVSRVTISLSILDCSVELIIRNWENQRYLNKSVESVVKEYSKLLDVTDLRALVKQQSFASWNNSEQLEEIMDDDAFGEDATTAFAGFLDIKEYEPILEHIAGSSFEDLIKRMVTAVDSLEMQKDLSLINGSFLAKHDLLSLIELKSILGLYRRRDSFGRLFYQLISAMTLQNLDRQIQSKNGSGINSSSTDHSLGFLKLFISMYFLGIVLWYFTVIKQANKHIKIRSIIMLMLPLKLLQTNMSVVSMLKERKKQSWGFTLK
jgi:hypothetical protein